MKRSIIGYFLVVICLMCFLSESSSANPNEVYSKHAVKMRIVREAINHGIDPALALSIAKQESNFNRAAKSRVGAIGLFQLMPGTARLLGVDPYYIDENITGGLTYIKSLKNQFGSTELALAAYNAGPGAVKKYGWRIPPYRETRHYVKNIMSFYRYYQKYSDPAIAQVYEEQVDEETANNEPQEEPAAQTAEIVESKSQNDNNIAINFLSRIWDFFSLPQATGNVQVLTDIL